MRNVDKKVLKEDRDNFMRDNKYLKDQLAQETAYKEQLLNERSDLVLSNGELTQRVKNLEKELAVLKKRVSDLENIFYKNGVTEEQLEQMLLKDIMICLQEERNQQVK